MKKTIFIIFSCIGIFQIATGSLTMRPINPDPSANNTSFMYDYRQKQDTTMKSIYQCPMHPEIVQDKAGKCQKCGMNLVVKEVKTDVYTCPMHPEVVQNKAGKCPSCGMNLVKKETVKKEPAKKS